MRTTKPGPQQLILDLTPRPAPPAAPPDPLAEERAGYATRSAQWELEHAARVERWADEAAERRRRKALQMPACVRARRYAQAGGDPW
jgi:hypothetical protein